MTFENKYCKGSAKYLLYCAWYLKNHDAAESQSNEHIPTILTIMWVKTLIRDQVKATVNSNYYCYYNY